MGEGEQVRRMEHVLATCRAESGSIQIKHRGLRGHGTSVFKSGNTYTVTAYVDTEDRLGAKIHSGYVCTIRYMRHSYHLVYLQFA